MALNRVVRSAIYCLLHGYLTLKAFVQSLADPCVNVKSTEFGQVIAIVWVDDFIIAGSDTDVLKKAKESLMMRFKMKDLGVLLWFLNIQFNCENDRIETLAQTSLWKRL